MTKPMSIEERLDARAKIINDAHQSAERHITVATASLACRATKHEECLGDGQRVAGRLGCLCECHDEGARP